MPNVLAPEAAGGISTRRNDMVARNAIDAQTDEVARNQPRSGSLFAAGLLPSVLGAMSPHFVPGASPWTWPEVTTLSAREWTGRPAPVWHSCRPCWT